MGDIKWSDRQMIAIKEEGKNMLVSASAGSGKTAVLSERIARIVCENRVDIDKFVVVTFTRAAASEMKTRIAKKLNERKQDENIDDSLRDYIDEQLILLERANISTLDSFNVTLLRDYFYVAGIEPNFKILDEVDERIISNSVITKMFDKYYKEHNDMFIELIKIYSNEKSDDGLKTMVLNLYDYIINTPNPSKALSNMLDNYDKDFEKGLYYKYFKDYVIKVTSDYKKEYSGFYEEHNLLKLEYQFMDNILNSTFSYQSIYDVINNFKFETLKFGKDFDEEYKKEIQNTRNDFKEFIKDLKDNFLVNTKEEFEKQIEETKPQLKMLVDLTAEYRDLFFEEKKKNNAYGFNDLAHLVINLLTKEDGSKTDIALNLTNNFEYIIVDEYQDVNNIQETILEAISRKGDGSANMFMVGDVKQSIYGFRNADSDIFTLKYNAYKEGKEDDGVKVDLNQNYRSRKEVLDSINYIFSKVMRKELGGIEYDDEMALKYGDLYTDNKDMDYKTELVLVPPATQVINMLKVNPQEENNSDDNKLEENNSEEVIKLITEGKDAMLQAMYIADEIEKLLENFKVQDKDGDKVIFRDLQYSDIAILYRSLKTNAEEVYRELKRRGIPAVITKQDNFMEELDVKLTIDVLKSIDNPYDNIAFVGTLYSDAYKFSPEELMTLKKRNRYKVSFFDMIESEYKFLTKDDEKEKEEIEKEENEELEEQEDNNIEETIDETNEEQKEDLREKYPLELTTINKIKMVHETYFHLKKFANKNSLCDLVKEIYDLFNKEKYFLGFMNMKQKVDNMNLFITYAKKFEESGSKNIYDFLDTIKKIEENKKDIQLRMPLESSNAVQIMTIHKSKGLEFPVVFVPNLEKNFNKLDLITRTLMEKELGFSTKYINTKKAYTKTTLFYQITKEKLIEELIAEELRIFYVAFTRAKEKLYLVSSYNTDNISNHTNSLENDLIKYSKLINTSSALSFILPCIYSKSMVSADTYFNVTIPEIDVMKKTYEAIQDEITIKTLFGQIADEESDNNFIYPYDDVTKIKQKVSVTEVKKRKIEELEIEEADSIIKEKDIEEAKYYRAKSDIFRKLKRKNKDELTGAEKGTIMHKLAKIINDKDIDKEFDRLIDNNIFTKDELDQIDKEKILMYLETDTYERISKSPFVKRELPFMMKKKACEVYKDVTSTDEVIIQGIIDLLFEEDGKLVILDYKTDKVLKSELPKDERIKELVKHYKPQLDLYEEAVRGIYPDKEIKEKVLYLFDCGDTVNVEE